MTAKTMSIGVELLAGSQSAKHEMIHMKMLMMRVLTLPIKSAVKPAKNRPKNEPALSKARIWNPKASLWPWVVAYDEMYVRGTKMPHSIRNIPSVTNVNGSSLNTRKSGEIDLKLAMGFLGSLLRTSRLAIMRRNRSINPKIRVDHAKPTLGRSLWSMRGKIIPPKEPEVMAIPVALPRLTRKKWPMDAMHGVLIRQPPMPLSTL